MLCFVLPKQSIFPRLFVVVFKKKNIFNVILQTIRDAIASSFNTAEMIQIFGDQSLDEFASRLMSLEENFKLKKISIGDYESKKVFNFHHQKCHLIHNND